MWDCYLCSQREGYSGRLAFWASTQITVTQGPVRKIAGIMAFKPFYCGLYWFLCRGRVLVYLAKRQWENIQLIDSARMSRISP